MKTSLASFPETERPAPIATQGSGRSEVDLSLLLPFWTFATVACLLFWWWVGSLIAGMLG